MRVTRLLVAAAFLSGTAAAADLSTLTGKKYKGDLASINDGVLVIRTDAGPIGVAVKEAFVLDFGHKADVPAKGTKYDEIELTDGSLLRCAAFKIKGKAIEPTPLAGPSGATAPKCDVPLAAAFAILRGGEDPKAREEWRKLLAGRGKRDLFVIKGADGFSPVPGTVLSGNDAGDAVQFERESDGQTVAFKLARATGGLVFNQPPRGVIPPTVCKVIDVFGNVLTAQAVQAAGPGLKVTTVAGAVFAYESTAAVSKLDFSQGNVAYLSDLEPTVSAPPAVPGEPYFTFLRDKTHENVPLKLDGVSYAKGLWVFPDTVLTFKLGGDYREFKALVGVDDSVQVATSAVKLTIEADGRGVFSQTVSRKDKPKPLTLDVKGVKELRLTVERDGLFLGNQLNLAEARVQK